MSFYERVAIVDRKLERAVEPAFVAVRGPTREGNFARCALADKRLYQLCELMCMRIEDGARQRAKELAR
jgi:hypothetical protein